MHYKKQLKRLHLTHKLIGQQRELLRTMRLEGFTAVTFHTTTRQLTLPNEDGAANEAAGVYDEWWSNRRKELKAQSHEVYQQMVTDEQLDVRRRTRIDQS